MNNQQLSLDLLLETAPSLTNFVAGHNEELLAHLASLPSESSPRLLLIWGDAGSGKTHLLKALSQKGRFISSKVAQPEHALGTLEAVLSTSELPAVLALDDIEHWPQNCHDAIFALQNRYKKSVDCSLVISSGLSPAHLAIELEQRSDLVSRLSWGLTLRVHELTDENKMAALSNFLDQRGSQYSADVLNYLLTHQSRNIKDLAKLVDHIDRYAFGHKRAITIPLVKQFLSTQL